MMGAGDKDGSLGEGGRPLAGNFRHGTILAGNFSHWHHGGRAGSFMIDLTPCSGLGRWNSNETKLDSTRRQHILAQRPRRSFSAARNRVNAGWSGRASGRWGSAAIPTTIDAALRFRAQFWHASSEIEHILLSIPMLKLPHC